MWWNNETQTITVDAIYLSIYFLYSATCEMPMPPWKIAICGAVYKPICAISNQKTFGAAKLFLLNKLKIINYVWNCGMFYCIVILWKNSCACAGRNGAGLIVTFMGVKHDMRITSLDVNVELAPKVMLTGHFLVQLWISCSVYH